MAQWFISSMTSSWPRLVVVTMLSCAIGCERERPTTDSPIVVRVGTSVPGGGFIALAEALLPGLRSNIQGVEIQLVRTRGAVANLRGVHAGEFDFAFVFSDTAYETLNSGTASPAGSAPGISGVAVLQTAPVMIVAGAESGIRSIEDLRGRRVAIGGSGTAILELSTLLLNSAGVPLTSIRRVDVPLETVAEMVNRGEADGFFEMAALSGAVERALAGGASLIPLRDDFIERIRVDRPFLHPTVVSKANYRHVDNSVLTIGVDGMLICRPDLDDELVHHFTRALVSAATALSSEGRWNFIALDQFAATPVPLHPGARRYYREQELRR